MNDQEEDLEGFCFSCAKKNPYFAPTQTELLHNPWPVLIKSKTLDFRSQPLINLMYTPTPLSDIHQITLRRRQADRVKPTREDIADFYDSYAYFHEYVHLGYLYWTPAKEVAKLALALCYDYILQMGLDSSPLPPEESWKRYKRNSLWLTEIARNIGLVEELIATALSIRAMENQMLPGGKWIGFQDALETLKRDALLNEEKRFPGFRATYERIEPIINLIYGNPSLYTAILPFLQPVRRTETISGDTSLNAMDALSYLNIILDFLESSDNAETVSRRLQQLSELEEIKDEIKAWQYTLGLELEQVHQVVIDKNFTHRISAAFLERFWNIARGSIEQQSLDDSWVYAGETVKRLQDIFTTGNVPSGPKMLAVLQRDRYRTRGFFDIHYLEWSDIPLQEEKEEVQTDLSLLAYYDGIRQQLVARKGFFCPKQRGKRGCQCSQTARKRFLRLSHLAFDGLFGSGEWSVPPCLSSRRL